jgi:transposase-like protein
MSEKMYAKKLKESVFIKLANGENALFKELNIPENTLYTWRTKALTGSSATIKKASKWSSKYKFQAILETASLSELETSKYCRKKGIHPRELNSWIKQCQNANNTKLDH